MSSSEEIKEGIKGLNLGKEDNKMENQEVKKELQIVEKEDNKEMKIEGDGDHSKELKVEKAVTFDDILNKVYEDEKVVNIPPKDDEIIPEDIFVAYNAHFNWHLPSNDNKSLDDTNAALAVSILEENFSLASEEMKIYTIKYYSNELVSNMLAHIYFSIQLKKYDDAERNIELVLLKILEITKNQYLGFENVDGFLYIIKGLEAFLWFKKGDNPEKFKNLLIEMSSFDYFALGQKAKIGVLAACFYFYNFFSKELRLDEQNTILLKLQVLDSDSAEWHTLMYRLLRDKRRLSDRFQAPSNDEKSELAIALTLGSGPNGPLPHPLAQSSKIICLAEIIKGIGKDSKFTEPIEIAELSFLNEIEAVDYIKRESKRLALEFKNDYRIHMDIADSLSRILPFKHRCEEELVKNCMEKCISLGCYPNVLNSTTYHKYGLYQLTSRSDLEFKKAEDSFSKAFKYNPNNFPALIDLLQIRVSKAQSPEEAEETLKLFESELKDPRRDKEKLSNILFVKGIFHLIREETLEAVNSWNEGFELNKKTLEFGRLSYFIKRYQWIRINVYQVRTAVSTVHKDNPEKYKGLLEFVEKQCESQDSWAKNKDGNSNSNRGRGEGNRSGSNRGGRGGRGRGDHNKGKGKKDSDSIWRKGAGGGVANFNSQNQNKASSSNTNEKDKQQSTSASKNDEKASNARCAALFPSTSKGKDQDSNQSSTTNNTASETNVPKPKERPKFKRDNGNTSDTIQTMVIRQPHPPKEGSGFEFAQKTNNY